MPTAVVSTTAAMTSRALKTIKTGTFACLRVTYAGIRTGDLLMSKVHIVSLICPCNSVWTFTYKAKWDKLEMISNYAAAPM